MSFRRNATATGYRHGYLRSRAWFARRDRWFEAEHTTRGTVRCELCGAAGDAGTFELHHVDYRGVSRNADGTWSAHEAHEDLIPLHPLHHEWVHQLIDRDRALARMGSRRDATTQAITRLREQLPPAKETT